MFVEVVTTLIEMYGCRDSFGVATISIFSVVVKSDVKSYHQLQGALDVSLGIQALVQQGEYQHITKSSSAAGRTRRQLGNTSTCPTKCISTYNKAIISCRTH